MDLLRVLLDHQTDPYLRTNVFDSSVLHALCYAAETRADAAVMSIRAT